MNGNDISRLSYKELQALALRYRVPGNIKKKLLVKVLQAAKGGNENEVGRLLQDLKQTRKKRIKRIKRSRLGLTSTPLHSPDYMAEDYYCPAQQPPYQWVGAEEEIASREDDNRIPHYEEFKQFLLKRMQREFQTYDSNNNQIEETNIVDLRTVTPSSSIQTVPIETSNYTKSNVIAVSDTDPLLYQANSHVEYQTLDDSNSIAQGSILLKKMLEAPVGANLGEIASPVLNNYRVWSMDHYQSNNLLDNSDTLTAESENPDEDNLESNTDCYGLLSGIRGEYFLNEPTFIRNVEEIEQQISNVSTNENGTQYRYSATNIDTRQSYENWTIANVMEATDANCVTSDIQSSKVFQTIYYDNTGPGDSNKPIQDESLTCQYRAIENVQSYNPDQSLFHANPSEENQYYEGSVNSNIHFDSPNTYYLQNLKQSTETNGEYFHNVPTLSNKNIEQVSYTSTASQTFSNDIQYHSVGLPYEYSYPPANQENLSLPENLQQQIQPEQEYAYASRAESNIRQNAEPDRVETANGILEPFWPKRLFKNAPDPILENILNIYNSKHVDLSRVDQTSSVYCYIAPIVTHTPVLSGSICSQKERFVAEYRQHSFSPSSLLYNDTSSGMRMANLQSKLGEDVKEGTRISSYMSPMFNGNENTNNDAGGDENEVEDDDDDDEDENDDDEDNEDEDDDGNHETNNNFNKMKVQESVEQNGDSITDVWPHSYIYNETAIEQDSNIEDLNVEVTDCLFSVITSESLSTQLDCATNQAQ